MNIKSVLISAAAFALMLAGATAYAAPADTAMSPKLRVEREFRTLETVLNRYVQNEVLKAGDLEQMNRMLHYFMLENPGIARIVRVNAGGHSVNDISAGSPHSAPPRNISAQKWFQQISQTKRAYYNMDVGSGSGPLTLFYAWPLMTGPERNAFSGAVAAIIDFTAQAALIENTPPFQIALQGRPFFQHDWDEFDYNEEPLEIRGTSGLTIRTMKEIRTRLDPIAQAAAQKKADSDGGSEADSAPEQWHIPTDDETVAKGRFGTGFGAETIKKGVIALLAIIALLLAYSIAKGRADKKKKFARDEPLPPEKPTGSIVIANMAETPKEQTGPVTLRGAWTPVMMQESATPEELAVLEEMEEAETAATPAPKQEGDRRTNMAGRRDTDSEQMEIINRMLTLIREDFIIMDKKIQLLSQRIGDIEDFLTKIK